MNTPRPERSQGARLEDLWYELEKGRSFGLLRSSNFSEVARYLSEQGLQVSLDELSYIHQRLARYGGPFATPRWLSAFVATLLGSRAVRTILDPCAGQGVFAADVAVAIEAERFDAVTTDPDAETIQGLLGITSYRLHTGDWEDAQEGLLGSYDAIVCLPPVGRPEIATFEAAQETFQVRDDPSLILLLQAAPRLSPKGFMLWMVPPRFLWETSALSVRRNLDRFGLHLRALLELPTRAFPDTSLRFSLALIDHQVHDRLYVAEVPIEEDGQEQLIERIRR